MQDGARIAESEHDALAVELVLQIVLQPYIGRIDAGVPEPRERRVRALERGTRLAVGIGVFVDRHPVDLHRGIRAAHRHVEIAKLAIVAQFPRLRAFARDVAIAVGHAVVHAPALQVLAVGNVDQCALWGGQLNPRIAVELSAEIEDREGNSTAFEVSSKAAAEFGCLAAGLQRDAYVLDAGVFERAVYFSVEHPGDVRLMSSAQVDDFALRHDALRPNLALDQHRRLAFLQQHPHELALRNHPRRIPGSVVEAWFHPVDGVGGSVIDFTGTDEIGDFVGRAIPASGRTHAPIAACSTDLTAAVSRIDF